jgi:CO/xanthine dehydrogenase FAD-binding subunit
MTTPKIYHRPATLDEAVELVAETGGLALAGGALTLGSLEAPYPVVVDLQDLHELQVIEARADSLYIGGVATLQQVVESPLVNPMIKESLTRSLVLNHRNGASVSESLLTPNPPREWLAALVAHNAYVEHAGQDDKPGKLSLWDQPLYEFVEFVYKHHHPYRGVLTGLHIPTPAERSVVGVAHVARTPADDPIVNAAATVTLGADGKVKSAAVAIGGASAQPVLRLELYSLVSSPLDEANIASAVKVVEPNVHPVEDYRGSFEYRAEMARLLTHRALVDCMAQLAG